MLARIAGLLLVACGLRREVVFPDRHRDTGLRRAVDRYKHALRNRARGRQSCVIGALREVQSEARQWIGAHYGWFQAAIRSRVNKEMKRIVGEDRGLGISRRQAADISAEWARASECRFWGRGVSCYAFVRAIVKYYPDVTRAFYSAIWRSVRDGWKDVRPFISADDLESSRDWRERQERDYGRDQLDTLARKESAARDSMVLGNIESVLNHGKPRDRGALRLWLDTCKGLTWSEAWNRQNDKPAHVETIRREINRGKQVLTIPSLAEASRIVMEAVLVHWEKATQPDTAIPPVNVDDKLERYSVRTYKRAWGFWDQARLGEYTNPLSAEYKPDTDWATIAKQETEYMENTTKRLDAMLLAIGENPESF